MPRPARLTEADRRQIVADYATMTQQQLARRYGVCWQTIRNCLDEMGVERRPRGWPLGRRRAKPRRPPEHSGWIGERLRERRGLSQNELAERVGISLAQASSAAIAAARAPQGADRAGVM